MLSRQMPTGQSHWHVHGLKMPHPQSVLVFSQPWLGLAEGLSLGCELGVWLGLLEGWELGASLGRLEGWPLGASLGRLEGWPDGCGEGCPDGCPDGCGEGCSLGAGEGWPDGCDVGDMMAVHVPAPPVRKHWSNAPKSVIPAQMPASAPA